MSDLYEFEEATNDKNAAIGMIGGLAIGLAGLAVKACKDFLQNKEEEEKARQAQKQGRYNDLDAKWFLSSAQKEEKAKLFEELKKYK